jgi:hypothetical protein
LLFVHGVFKGRNGQRFGRLKMEAQPMAAKEPAISPTGLESIAAAQQSAVVEMRALLRMRLALAMVIAAVLALTLSTAAHAATIVVNSLADPGAKGICALRDAITAANTKTATNGCTAGTGKDTIRFSVTGTILLASTLPQVTDLQLTINGPASPGITIDGGNKGDETGVQVMKVASCATLDLRNLTIAHGFSGTPNAAGGGILNDGTLTVTNSTFSDNAVAGIFETGNNAAGGAIYNGGTLTVTDSSFSRNGAFGPISDTGDGGGIYNNGTLAVTKSTFSGNDAPSTGGGIANYNNGRLTVTNSIFSNNFTVLSGGGIVNFGTLSVTNSTFSGNSTAGILFPGGGIENGRTASIADSTFTGNGFGGAGNGGVLTVTNSTFTDGIFSDDALVVTNCTFLNGFIDNFAFASLKNTILASNVSSPSTNCFGTETIIDAGYNISDDNSCGFSATGSRNNTNPLLDPKGLQYNGGPTETIALDSESPAIDAIPFANCTDQFVNRISTDQRGALRPDAGELQCDIGAYEFQDFAGQPDCDSKNIFALIQRFGSLEAAASALGFPSVKALLKAIQISCGG